MDGVSSSSVLAENGTAALFLPVALPGTPGGSEDPPWGLGSPVPKWEPRG